MRFYPLAETNRVIKIFKLLDSPPQDHKLNADRISKILTDRRAHDGSLYIHGELFADQRRRI